MWNDFLTSHGFTSHTLQFWSHLSISAQLHLLISFIKWLHEVYHYATSTIRQTISGVRDYIRGHLQDLAAFSHDSIALALKATEPSGRLHSTQRDRRQRLPVTIEMIHWYKGKAWRTDPVCSRIDFDNRMVFLGVVMGLTFLRRVSEYAYDHRSDHTIHSDDVHLISDHDPPLVVPSFELPEHTRVIERVQTMRFTFRTTKTIRAQQRPLYLFLSRHNPVEYEIMNYYIHWSMIAGLESGKPFLSRVYQGRRKVLRACMVNEALKEIADNFGFRHVRDLFTSHSLRIGGATTLIALGSSRETIQRIGGWSVAATSSDSIYELSTPRENSNLWSAINSQSGGHVSTNDIHSIIPPKNRQRK